MKIAVEVGQLRAAVFLIGGLIRERAVAGRPVPHNVIGLYRHFDTLTSVSPPGHREGGDFVELTTKQVAALLGWGERKVRRHAADLGGRRVGDRLVYPAKAVHQYAQALRDERTM